MKKIISLLLALCILLGMLSMAAFAVDYPVGDVSRNYKVTAYDALLVQSQLHNEYNMDNEQMQLALDTVPAITKLSTAHVMATLFIPLTGKSEITPEADGRYHIREPKDMELLHTFPYAGIVLENDIDMTGVWEWTPSYFCGDLDGNGYTIRNMATAAATSSNAGVLFTTLGNSSTKTAAVHDLTLEDCTLVTNNKTLQTGAICGGCYGTITDCKSINVIATNGAFDGKQLGNYGWISGGAMEVQNMVNPVPEKRELVVGYMEQMARIKWRVPREVSFACERYNNPCNCAEGSVDVAGHRYYADRVYTGMPYCNNGCGLENILENATPGQDGVYTIDDALTINYGTNTEYSLVHAIKPEWPSYFCNDCSSAVQWAWAQVAPSISFRRTGDMVPSTSHINNFGIVKLGSYYIDEEHPSHTCWTSGDEYRSILQDEDGNIIPERLNDLYNSYMQLQPGDAIVYAVNDLGGHARLVHHVKLEYDGFGNIDPEYSKVVCIEQCGGTYNKPAKRGQNGKIEGEYTTWKYMSEYSFKALASVEQLTARTTRPAVYVPITCAELQGGDVPQAYVKFKGGSASPYQGVVASNYRVVGTRLTIDGKTDVQQTGWYGPYVGQNYVYQFNTENKNIKTYSYYDRWRGEYVNFTGYLGNFYEGVDESGSIPGNKSPDTGRCGANRLIYKSVNLAKHADAFENLASGTYNYALTVDLINGMSYTFNGVFTK